MGQKFQCEYQARYKSALVTHQKAVHMGQKFQWPECDYQATMKSSLVTLESVHMGQRFQCPECDHKATKRGNLVFITNLYIWAKNSNVQSVIIKQQRKVT